MTEAYGTFSSGWTERCGYREVAGNWEGNLRWLKHDFDMEGVELFDESEYYDKDLKIKFEVRMRMG